MQQLIEPPRAPKRRSHQFVAVVLCIVFSASFAIFVLPQLDDGVDVSVLPGRASSPPPLVVAVSRELPSRREKNNLIPPPQQQSTPVKVNQSTDDVLEPWGYHAGRNPPRWVAIRASIREDLAHHQGVFTVVDYGADAGYFSIATAKEFPGAVVIAVELGGSGGVIWKKLDKDVHSTQEEMMTKLNVNNVMICQTLVDVSYFAEFNAAGQMHTYQYVLSVFHWFALKTREEFEKSVTELFTNARTTFIELPTVGDNSKLIQKQSGYKNWIRWYDGRTDVADILQTALSRYHLRARIRLLVSVPWLRWTRNVYRVDVDSEENSSRDYYAHRTFSCSEHRRILRCRPRSTRQECRGRSQQDPSLL